jgi:hypothetical protein
VLPLTRWGIGHAHCANFGPAIKTDINTSCMTPAVLWMNVRRRITQHEEWPWHRIWQLWWTMFGLEDALKSGGRKSKVEGRTNDSHFTTPSRTGLGYIVHNYYPMNVQWMSQDGRERASKNTLTTRLRLVVNHSPSIPPVGFPCSTNANMGG